MENQPVLVTLTAPSAAGKSYLFNYIRDVAKLPCLISTTTRSPRANEVEGVDYFFISQEESYRLEAAGEFAELAIYNGNRYGVTKEEFHSKLQQGIAFLIVEPTGIEHYAAPAIEVGALHYKAFIHVDPEVRMQRFKERAKQDLAKAIARNYFDEGNYETLKADCFAAQATSISRLEQMLTTEMKWFQVAQWDRVLFGEALPEENLQIILDDIKKLRQPKI